MNTDMLKGNKRVGLNVGAPTERRGVRVVDAGISKSPAQIVLEDYLAANGIYHIDAAKLLHDTSDMTKEGKVEFIGYLLRNGGYNDGYNPSVKSHIPRVKGEYYSTKCRSRMETGFAKCPNCGEMSLGIQVAQIRATDEAVTSIKHCEECNWHSKS